MLQKLSSAVVVISTLRVNEVMKTKAKHYYADTKADAKGSTIALLTIKQKYLKHGNEIMSESSHV